jgi:hypothetical protein
MVQQPFVIAFALAKPIPVVVSFQISKKIESLAGKTREPRLCRSTLALFGLLPSEDHQSRWKAIDLSKKLNLGFSERYIVVGNAHFKRSVVRRGWAL